MMQWEPNRRWMHAEVDEPDRFRLVEQQPEYAEPARSGTFTEGASFSVAGPVSDGLPVAEEFVVGVVAAVSASPSVRSRLVWGVSCSR